jgi:TolA-binding protein
MMENILSRTGHAKLCASTICLIALMASSAVLAQTAPNTVPVTPTALGEAQAATVPPVVALASVAPPEAVAVTIPTPVPVIFPPSLGAVPLPVAQTPETLSARTLVRLEQLTRELSETIGRVEALEAAVTSQKTENQRLIGLMDAARAAPVVADAASPAPVATAIAAATSPATDAQTGTFVAPTPPPIAPAIMLTNAQAALQTGGYPVAEANLVQLIWVYPHGVVLRRLMSII